MSQSKDTEQRSFGRFIAETVASPTRIPFLVVVAVILIFQAMNPTFLSYQGFVTLVYAMSYFLIAACGLTFVVMMGSFDFSSISVMKFSALLCVLYIDDFGLWIIPITLLGCAIIGFVSGFLVAKLGVPSFMATLGISIVVDGISLLMSKGFLHLMEHEGFRSIATTFIAGIPSVFHWSIAIWILCAVLAATTPFGRRTYAIGGNARAAVLSGINLDSQRIQVFMLSAILSGAAGVFYMSQLGGGSVEIGGQMMIPLFASVVAGGTSLRGGNGGPQNTLLGVIIITWIQSGLRMMGTGMETQMVILGIIAIGMSIATTDRNKFRRVIVK
ncbi:MAG: ABC transporter permease [Spirochaetia bacterium]|jgi:ribose transport system permease protein/putative xylitol transport system permease protein|nr:ABC transporter permease [Spirochaetia bacterium]